MKENKRERKKVREKEGEKCRTKDNRMGRRK
jgi:hypothetical protein